MSQLVCCKAEGNVESGKEMLMQRLNEINCKKKNESISEKTAERKNSNERNDAISPFEI